MKTRSKYLDDPTETLTFRRSVAVAIGDKEAIAIQQLRLFCDQFLFGWVRPSHGWATLCSQVCLIVDSQAEAP